MSSKSKQNKRKDLSVPSFLSYIILIVSLSLTLYLSWFCTMISLRVANQESPQIWQIHVHLN